MSRVVFNGVALTDVAAVRVSVRRNELEDCDMEQLTVVCDHLAAAAMRDLEGKTGELEVYVEERDRSGSSFTGTWMNAYCAKVHTAQLGPRHEAQNIARDSATIKHRPVTRTPIADGSAR